VTGSFFSRRPQIRALSGAYTHTKPPFFSTAPRYIPCLAVSLSPSLTTKATAENRWNPPEDAASRSEKLADAEGVRR
jgi:hypothetical protein